MNCQSQLVRLFLSSCCDDAFKTADKVECIGFLLRAVKGLYSAEPSNSCSILSDNSWDPISAEKWNELWLQIRISTLSPDKNHQTAAEGFILLQVTSLLASTGAELLWAPWTCPPHPGVKPEDQHLMGSQHVKGLSYYLLRGVGEDSKSLLVLSGPGFFFFFYCTWVIRYYLL